MFVLIFAALITTAPVPVHAAEPPAPVFVQDLSAEFERQLKAAAGDKTKLWALVDWCEARSMTRERRRALEAIVDVDGDDAKAHELLEHVWWEGEWYRSQAELDTHKRKLEKGRLKALDKEARAKGWVKHEGEWIDPADLPFIERGWVRDASGVWMSPEEFEKLAAGWVRQDFAWVSPEDAEQVKRGFWKCGEQWLKLAEANAWHASLEHPWHIPGKRFHVYATVSRRQAFTALDIMEAAHPDLVRAYGVAPTESAAVVCLKDDKQYAEFAKGREGSGLKGVHGTYQADGWFDETSESFPRACVTFWDRSTDSGDKFGSLFVRHAAGQAFADALDPSPRAEKARLEAGVEYRGANFWSEKRIPMWFRFGAATYIERYFTDAQHEDPLWARKWSIDNIKRGGELDALETILRFEVNPDEAETSARLYTEAGLLMAFMLDGECKPVVKAHTALRKALAAWVAEREDKKAARNLEKAFGKLEKALLGNARALRAFAQL